MNTPWWSMTGDERARAKQDDAHDREWIQVRALDVVVEFENARGEHCYRAGSRINHRWKCELSRRLAYLLAQTKLGGLPPGVTAEMPRDGFSFVALRQGNKRAVVVTPRGWALMGAIQELKPKRKQAHAKESSDVDEQQ